MFLLPGTSNESRARASPWHINGVRALMYMVIVAALTGLMEKVTYMGLRHQTEARVINFIGLSIMLFGTAVDLSVSLGRFALNPFSFFFLLFMILYTPFKIFMICFSVTRTTYYSSW
ncbi:probable transmembrane ascorbate ferrireductase 3 [Phtheirospermum japonicum]|uniref:Probable transmembrane ascorbate ferrireductase 3 n=1 Tax=Phtheirospermum japonicum TaxID=374723 RepID=A0A830BU14_9LAMI|nr:probable transmembrane ascorbate ferrireductase 3 [Phtheirospermum japonicum]